MKRKCTALLLALVMTLSLMTVSVGAAGSPFSDVTEADWFYKEAVYVKEQGLMLGSNGKFNPNAATSRAMIWMILARLDGTDTTPTDNEWFGVGKAWSIANGVSDGTDPNGSITRQQLAVMLYRYAMGKGCVKTGDYADLSAYADADSVSDYAREAMSWAVAVGLLNGTADGRLNPLGTATRAHVAVMLYRFGRLIGGTAAETYTVTFLYNYGKKGTYTTQAVAADDPAQRPKDPTRSGYDFAGWYDRATGGKRFTFGTAVTGDLTLYAHWTDDSDEDSGTSAHSHSYRYTCNNNGTHIAKCTCGSSYTENCALTRDETTGLSTCSVCGYAVYEISDWAAFVAAMAAGGNIKLTADLTANEAGQAVVPKAKTVHLDMNGHTITLPDGSPGYLDPLFNVKNGASLTIDGNGTVDLGANPGFSFIYPFGDVTINSGTYKIDTGLSSYGSFFVGISGGKGKLIINGGYFDGGYYVKGDCFNNCRNLLNVSWGQYIRVYGGTFVAQNPAWGDEGMAYLCTECEHKTNYCQGIFLDGQHWKDITMPAHYTITEGTTEDGRPTYTVNYDKTTAHTHNIYTNNGNGTHTAKCACGAVGETTAHTLDTNGLCVCDYAEAGTVEQMSAAVTAGKTNIKVIGEVYDAITADKTVDFKNAAFTAATANDEGISFTSADGQKYTISNAKFTGDTQAIFFGSYNKSNPGNYNTELKNVTLENIKTFGSYANKEKNVSCAAWVYGTAVLNDCTMKGTTSGNTDTNICCDVGFVNKSNATVSGGSFDSIYIYEQAHVTIENARVGKIVTGAITAYDLGCLTIKSGTTVDAIEINCSDSFTPALVIEDGATVSSIIYKGTTYTQAAWLAAMSGGSD